MPQFLSPSSKIWPSLLPLPGRPIPWILLVNSLTFFRSVLKYLFAREAFHDHYIWNSNCSPFLHFSLSLFIASWPNCLSAYCVSPTLTLLPSPLGISHWQIYVFLFGSSGSHRISRRFSIIYVINQDWPSTLLTYSVNQPKITEQSLYARHCVKSLSYGKWKDMVPAWSQERPWSGNVKGASPRMWKGWDFSKDWGRSLQVFKVTELRENRAHSRKFSILRLEARMQRRKG